MSTSPQPVSAPSPSAETVAALYRLAALQRPPGSAGEHAAAQLLAEELARRGVRARVEPERVHGTYWVPIGLASGITAVAGAAPRVLAGAVSLLAAASVADDLAIGRRPLRRVLRQRIAHNVLAEIRPREGEGDAPGDGNEDGDAHGDRDADGDGDAPGDADVDRDGDWDGRTVVVHAHHDAARTGIVFHPAGAKLMARLAGGLVERVGATPAPMWSAVAGPALVAAGAALGWRRAQLAGAAVSAAVAAAMVDIAHRPSVPGANDNLSGVCAVLELAQALAREPPHRLRVLLLSTGSEESFLEAMVGFGRRHFPALHRARTTFLCLESVGSPHLMLLAGEGLLSLKRYPQDLIETLTRLAGAAGVTLRAPFCYRLATDGQVPLRAGYPTAVISSMDRYKVPSNYHWPSDRPENVDLHRVSDAAQLAHAFISWLDDRPPADPGLR